MGQRKEPNSSAHYFERYISSIRLPNFWRALLISISSFLIFLALASVDANIRNTLLPALQFNISVSLFVGLWYGDIAFRDLRTWVEKSRIALNITGNSRKETDIIVPSLLASKKSHLLALPFLLAGLYIAFGSALDKNGTLLTNGLTPAFIFIVLEICVMVDLLGATGYWVLYTFLIYFKKLSEGNYFDYRFIDLDLLKKLMKHVRKLSIYLLFIIVSFLPSIVIVGIALGSWYGGATLLFGMLMPGVFWLSSYLLPRYYLKKIVTKGQEIQEREIREKISTLQKNLYGAKASGMKKENRISKTANSIFSLRQELKHIINEDGFASKYVEVVIVVINLIASPAIIAIVSSIFNGLVIQKVR